MKIRSVIHTLSLFALLLCACINDKPDEGSQVSVGDTLPQFTVTLNNGSIVSDTSLRGQHALIVFFHTSCSDCQHELPVIQQFFEAQQQCRVVCISREQETESVEAYWQQHNLTMPFSAQSTREVYSLFAASHIPQIFLVSPQGIIIRHWTDADMPTLETLLAAMSEDIDHPVVNM
ncbi:MAG: TlpA family protein disulfide reductase [Paludibacteraceae bacterium]|nr:TlpA family protein disulfide reductase [Paludibacteraceae bacterium]